MVTKDPSYDNVNVLDNTYSNTLNFLGTRDVARSRILEADCGLASDL